MARLRALAFSGLAPTRLYAIGFAGSGANSTNSQLRALGFSGTGTNAVVLNPLLDMANVEPETVIAITATLQAGSTADTWVWRQISGNAEIISGSSTPTLQIRAPSAMPPGATVSLGVVAKDGTVQSSERQVTISVLPQTRWIYDGNSWEGKSPTTWL